MFSSGVYFNCSTMYGLGAEPVGFDGVVTAFLPCMIFLKERLSFFCFCFDSVLFDVLLPIPPPALLILLEVAAPPLSLRLSIREEVDRVLGRKLIGYCNLLGSGHPAMICPHITNVGSAQVIQYFVR